MEARAKARALLENEGAFTLFRMQRGRMMMLSLRAAASMLAR